MQTGLEDGSWAYGFTLLPSHPRGVRMRDYVRRSSVQTGLVREARYLVTGPTACGTWDAPPSLATGTASWFEPHAPPAP